VVTDIQIDIQRPERSDWGCTDHRPGVPAEHYRRTLVETDGTVLAWDDVAGHYSRHHDLTEAEVAEAQRLAALVRAGTHWAAAGRVFAKRSDGPALIDAIREMWAKNCQLPPGSNAEIAARIEALRATFGLTLDDWHAWARAAASSTPHQA
jgi:hypothetical protein